MNYLDCPRPEFYSANIVKARKAHKCSECLADIKRGESYELVTGKWEGHVETFKTCNLCIDVRESVGLNDWVHGHLMDVLDVRDYPDHPLVAAFHERRLSNYELIGKDNGR